MRILNWVHTRLHGANCINKKSESSSGSARPAAADTPSGPRRDDDEIHDGWPAAMLSIGTVGIGEGNGDELKKQQEELALLMRAKAEATTVEDEDQRRHLTLNRSLNGGIVKQRSFRKFVSNVFSGFLPRPSFRETMPALRATEVSWPLLHNGTHPDNPASEAVIKKDRTAQMPWRGNAMGEEQGSRWIRTDTEYIVLEI